MFALAPPPSSGYSWSKNVPAAAIGRYVSMPGTPEGAGFGRKPPLWMKPGDFVEVEIDGGVGVLRNPIIAEA